MRKFFKTFGPGLALYLGQLFGENKLSRAPDWIWDAMLVTAICLGLISVISIDWVWKRLFDSWVPTVKVLTAKQRRNALPEWSPHLTLISDREYLNEKVVVDGIYFDNCRFKNVTFSYSGTGPFHLNNCKVSGDLGLESDLPAIKHYMTMANTFQAMIGKRFEFGRRNKDSGKFTVDFEGTTDSQVIQDKRIGQETQKE